METLPFLLLGLGFLASLIAGILYVVAGFRESTLWGVLNLLVPGAQLVFTFVHWHAAKTAFAGTLVGGVLVVAGILQLPALMRSPTGPLAALVQAAEAGGVPPLPLPGSAPAIGGDDLTAQIDRMREEIGNQYGKIEEEGKALQAVYAALEAKRGALSGTGSPAVSAFNREAADYKARTGAWQEAKRALAARQGELSELLARRAEGAATALPSARGKEVVVYSTSWCPACKVAKSYFASRGIPFREVDVERSPEGAAEFQRYGGNGVPLIVIGGRTVRGFDQNEVERLLKAQ
jgi:glutaredoxin